MHTVHSYALASYDVESLFTKIALKTIENIFEYNHKQGYLPKYLKGCYKWQLLKIIANECKLHCEMDCGKSLRFDFGFFTQLRNQLCQKNLKFSLHYTSFIFQLRNQLVYVNFEFLCLVFIAETWIILFWFIV